MIDFLTVELGEGLGWEKKSILPVRVVGKPEGKKAFLYKKAR